MMMMLMPRTAMLMTTAAIPMSMMPMPVIMCLRMLMPAARPIMLVCVLLRSSVIVTGLVCMFMIVPAADHAAAHEEIEDPHHRESQSAHQRKDFESTLQIRHIRGRPVNPSARNEIADHPTDHHENEHLKEQQEFPQPLTVVAFLIMRMRMNGSL